MASFSYLVNKLKNYFLLKKRIKKNEGFKNEPYFDSLGYKTIGYGHLIKKKEKQLFKNSISKKILSNIFELDFKKALISYKKNYIFKQYPKHIEEVLIEMIFQLGIKKQKKFVKMQKHIDNKNLFMAALEMKQSLWYKQTPKRVDGLIKILLKKEYEKKR